LTAKNEAATFTVNPHDGSSHNRICSFPGPLRNAQPTGCTSLGIIAIEALFDNSDLAFDLLPSFNPSAVMIVTIPGVGPISPGLTLSM